MPALTRCIDQVVGALKRGTPLGDLSPAHLWIRENLQVAITETNEDDFKRNPFVARAEMRAAFGVATPGALAIFKLNDPVDFPDEE